MEKRKPKVFILGVSGQLGYGLARALSNDFLVSGACYHHFLTIPEAQIFPIDPKKPEILETLVRVVSPDLVVNAAAMVSPEAIMANPKQADNLNILTAVTLATLSNRLKAPFVQLSCSTVYDGSDSDYSEDNLDFSLHNDFAKQKLAAESYIRAQTMESTILRVGAVMGMGHPYRASEFDRLRISLSTGKEITAAKKTTYSYLSLASFVSAIRLVLLGGPPGKHRLFNLGGPTMTEFEMFEGWATLMGRASLVKAPQDEYKRNYSINSKNFVAAFPEWKPETRPELYFNLLKEMSPGTSVKKWQKTLQIP